MTESLFFLKNVLVEIINERINCGPESASKGAKAASQSGRFSWFICVFVHTI